jgi:hypothetical protein
MRVTLTEDTIRNSNPESFEICTRWIQLPVPKRRDLPKKETPGSFEHCNENRVKWKRWGNVK